MEKDIKFLGTGWSFPPTFSKGYRGVMMTSDIEDIENSLKILLSTIKGERVMQPEYGCNLDALVFESLDMNTKTYLMEMISTSILIYEPRILIDKLEILTLESDQGLVQIHIDYIVKLTNSRYNLVYQLSTET